MSNLKDLVKNGWHPEKQGTTLRGQVSNLVGRGSGAASSTDRARAEHVSRPLADLRDPSSFAPPPRRTANAAGLAAPPAPAARPSPPSGRDAANPPPSLPPRLPPRAAGSGSQPSGGPLDPSQAAASRLGATGVSVPALGIGRSGPANPASPSPPPPARSAAGTGAGAPHANVNELQGRFSKLGMLGSGSSAAPASTGTTWAQKQAALKTASSFHKDPSSVSLADAGAAASTANKFRQRHGHQVAAGIKGANSLNQKYGVTDKVGAYAGRRTQDQATAADAASSDLLPGLAGKKKPPPPPKKPSLGSSTKLPVADDDEPPPIPMATRPTF